MAKGSCTDACQKAGRSRIGLESLDARQQNQLRVWQDLYDGLSETDIEEIEEIALDRSRFMKPAADG